MNLALVFLSLLVQDHSFTINSDIFTTHEATPLYGQGANGATWRLRLNQESFFGEHWRLEAAYETQQQRRSNLAPILFTQAPLRAADFDLVASQRDNTATLHRLDRLNMTYETTDWRITLGRQAVGHGNGRFFNPSDIFGPLSPFSLNTQYKAGVDGLRITRALPNLAEVEALYLASEDQDDLALLRWGGIVREIDISIFAGTSYREPTLGWDIAGTAIGAAIYTEGIWREGRDRENPYRLAAGFQRRMNPKLDLTIEVHHQNLEPPPIFRLLSQPSPDLPIPDLPLPTDQIIDILLQTFPPEWRNGETYLQEETHLAILLSYEAHPLIRTSLAVLGETEENSARITASLDWDVSQNGSLSLGYLATSGEAFTEFGSSGNAAYAELRLTLP